MSGVTQRPYMAVAVSPKLMYVGPHSTLWQFNSASGSDAVPVTLMVSPTVTVVLDAVTEIVIGAFGPGAGSQ
ncbi:MAG: hypothetical protein E6G04_07815 [Actinobacteria bacterium]|nr:MAG: hypothetical protein E6G04_07815 [Actinomycetota bacterium]